MGVLFHWFKDIKVQIESYHPMCEIADIVYIDGDSTSHSYGNRSKLQNLFREKCGVEIPTIYESLINSENYKFDLVEPSDMVEYCDKLLSTKECNIDRFRERIEWIKSLSLQGYYIAYEAD